MSWKPDAGFWHGRQVAVTGGTGFLGSHLVAALNDLGAHVVVITRALRPAGDPIAGWGDGVEQARGDVRDQSFMESVLGRTGAQTLIHLAGQSQVGLANAEPTATFDANIGGTWATLEAARRTPTLEGTLVASTDRVYGAPDALPCTEEMALRAVNPYDVSKAAADMITAGYASSLGLPVAITRCANLYGPGDTNWERLIPGTLRLLLSGQRPVLRSDGTRVRDYLYIEDGVRGYLQLAEALAAQPEQLRGQAFNFSAEEPLRVLEVVALLGQVVGTDVEPDVENVSSGEIDRIHLSAAKARRVLGWQPDVPMADGLELTVPWYKNAIGA